MLCLAPKHVIMGLLIIRCVPNTGNDLKASQERSGHLGIVYHARYLGFRTECYFYLGFFPQPNPRRVFVVEDSDVWCSHFLLFIYLFLNSSSQTALVLNLGLGHLPTDLSIPWISLWEMCCPDTCSILMSEYFHVAPSAVLFKWKPAYCTVSHSGINVCVLFEYSL